MERELWQYLKTVKKPIVLYGMGNGADKIIKVLERYCIGFDGVFASDGFVRDKLFYGYKVTSYQNLKEKFGDMIVLLCFGSERPEVLENVRKIALEQELYAPEVPVIGEGLFDKSYVEKNKSGFEKIYSLLADEKSRQTFKNIIKFKLSGKIEYLFDCQVEKDEPYESFLKLNENESFLDLGAYNGDTVSDFIERVPNYSKIIAVEPDVKSYKKLIKNTETLRDIYCHNVCISNFSGMGNFGMRAGRNSGVSESGSQTVFTTVDDLLKNSSVGFIKMDVEGEEKKAIEGAVNTISQHKPKMLISCYHRTEDLISIPNTVFSIRNDYKLYIRHFPSLPAWDTAYFFV